MLMLGRCSNNFLPPMAPACGDGVFMVGADANDDRGLVLNCCVDVVESLDKGDFGLGNVEFVDFVDDTLALKLGSTSTKSDPRATLPNSSVGDDMWSAALLQWLGLAWLGGEPVRVVSSSLSSLSSKMFKANFLLLVDRGVAFFFRELDLGVFLTLRDEWARMELGLMDPSTFPRGDSGFMLDRSIDVLMNCIFSHSKTTGRNCTKKVKNKCDFWKLHFEFGRTRRTPYR